MHRRCSLIAVAACAMAAAGASSSQAPARHKSVDLSGLAQATRPVSNTYPVSGPTHIFISNQYGAVRVVPWGEQVVRVTAEIRVGAETMAMAGRYAQQVEVTGNHVGERIEVQTKYPRPEPPSNPSFETNIEVNVPASASVEVVNTFGDVSVRGLEGDLLVDARFSDVDLRDLSGAVRVRMRGQYKLAAEDLHKGGVFVLRSTDATFTRVAGDLKVDNYLGGVTLRPGSAPVRLDVTCESGPIHLYLDKAATPDLHATADSGVIHSDLALKSETWGKTTTARNANPDSPQHMELFTSFSDIGVHQETLAAAAEPQAPPSGTPITETKSQEFDLPIGNALRLNLMPGAVTVEGHDGPRVEVTASRFVRVADVSKARLAVEALALRADPGADYLGITTAVQDDMKAIGCTEYRLDLVIRVPRGAAVTLRTQNGETKLAGLNGAVALEQEKGRVLMHDMQGGVTVRLKQGEIESTATAGALDLSAGGQITVRQSSGGLRVQSEGGNTLIDTPSGAVYARSHGGDVRLIALEGVRGDYDIAAENGNVSLAVPKSADALFLVNVYTGTVLSWVPLTGTSERDNHSYQGRLNTGSHRILLESRRGNIVIID